MHLHEMKKWNIKLISLMSAIYHQELIVKSCDLDSPTNGQNKHH